MYDYIASQGDLFAFAATKIKIEEPATASPGLYSPTLPLTETAPQGEAPLAIVAPGKAAPWALPDAALVMPPPARTDWTVSDIRAAIASWDLKDKKCRDLLTAVAHAADILAFGPVKLAGRAPWSCAGLNRVLWARPHLAYGLSVNAFNNMVSNLRTVLIRLGLHADSRYGVNQLSAEWQSLYDAIPSLERRKGLVRFFRYLTLMGITPATLEPQVINAFDTWCRTQILHRDPSGLSRRAASNWTFCREHVPGWPRVELHRAGMRNHYTLSWDAFPAPFTADVERYLKGLAAGPGLRKKLKNPFRELAEAEQKAPAVKSPRSIRRALKPRTIETRRYQIKLAATALVMSGEVPIERITSLATLVNPVENAATALEFHEARQRAQRLERGEDVSEVFLKSSHLLGIAEALRFAAFFASISLKFRRCVKVQAVKR